MLRQFVYTRRQIGNSIGNCERGWKEMDEDKKGTYVDLPPATLAVVNRKNGERVDAGYHRPHSKPEINENERQIITGNETHTTFRGVIDF
jgi:hypothetical protein